MNLAILFGTVAATVAGGVLLGAATMWAGLRLLGRSLARGPRGAARRSAPPT